MKMAAGQCFLLVCLVSISLFSTSQGSFSNVIQHYEKAILCPTKELIQKGDLICHLNGVPVPVEVFLQTGTICDVAYSDTSQRFFCKDGTWHDFGDLSVHRSKRCITLILLAAGLIATMKCIIFCRGKPESVHVNQRPDITCPKIQTVFDASPRERSVVVTWSMPNATDPEQGKLTPKQEDGLINGSRFQEGDHLILYSATDKHGVKDTCKIRFTVNVVRCNMIETPKNGQMTCVPLHHDAILGTTCSFSCNKGYQLSGSENRFCHDDLSFNGTQTKCTKIQCPDLKNPQHGNKFCSDGTYYNSRCGTNCTKVGYESEGGYINCQSDKTWSASLPSCQDKRSPWFTFCPISPVSVFADKENTSTEVVWDQPTASDNSGDVTITQTIGLTSGSDFAVGTHTISYVARDPSGNESPKPCKFDVVVENLECVSPDGKFDDPLIKTDCPGTEYTYGMTCNVSCIRNYDIIGNTTITCERAEPDSTKMVWDWGGGGQPTCDNKCPPLQTPANGAFVCKSTGNEYCRLSCNVAFGYPSGLSKNALFVCTDQQRWDPPEVDDCTERRPPDKNTVGGKLHYFVGDCNDPTVQSDLKDKFLVYMIELVNRGWSNRCPNDTGCVKDIITVHCGPVTSRRRRETITQNTSKSRSKPPQALKMVSRVKRASEKTHVIILEFKITITWIGGTSASDLKANDKDLRNMIDAIETEIANGGSALSIGDVTPAIVTADPNPPMECPFGQTARYYGDIPNCEGCATGKYYEAAESTCVKCPVGTYQNESHQTSCKACPLDTSTKETGRKSISECFPVCAAGRYSNSGVIPCTTCPVGEYQSNANSNSCNKCGVGRTTIGRGKSSLTACLSFDAVLSSAGLRMAFPLLTEALQVFTLMFWLHCPTGNVSRPSFGFGNASTSTEVFTYLDAHTLELFGTKIQIPKAGWAHFAIKWENTTNQAKLLINGFNINTVPVTARNFAVIGSYLTMTQGNGTKVGCRLSGLQMTNTSRTDTDILTDASSCSLTVDNPVYSIKDLKDQAGIDIETPSTCDEVDECVTNPCGVHFCENLLDGYKCFCKSGYTGHNCEIPPNFCTSNQCENRATCVNEAWDYTCLCPANFKGTLCEEEIVNGNWASWGYYGQCSQSCNGGIQTRIRTCSNPSPGPGGANCSGSGTEEASCNTDQCPACDPVGILLFQSRKTEKDYCVSDGDYTRCGIKCQQGMMFANQPLEYYECGANTSYEWNGIPPSCADSIPGRRLTINTSATYEKSLPCGMETNQALERVAGEAQCIRNRTCTSSVSTTGCSSKQERDMATTTHISFSINLEHLEDFELTALLEHNIVSDDLRTYLRAMKELEETAQQINKSVSDFFTVTINDVTYDIDPSTFSVNAEIECPNGSIVNDGACLKCPVGTRETNGLCMFCDEGTYQNEEGQTECLPCPIGYSTEFVGTIEIANCSVVHADQETTKQNINDGSTTEPPTDRSHDKGLSSGPLVIVILAVAITVTALAV